MADVKVPIKFQIYKGDALVREETLAQDVIKVGKLASSHLRIDDETVSRMHAVIEITGPDEIHIIDLGSTRGTLVNGERISKTRLQSGDEIMFGDSRVLVTFLDAASAQLTPPPQAAPSPRAAKTSMGLGGYAPPPPTSFAPPPAQQYAAPSYSAPAGGGGGGGFSMASPGVGAEVEVHDGTRAMEVQTVFRGVVTGARHLFNPEGKSTHGQGTSMVYAGLGAAVVALGLFVATAMDVGSEKLQYEQWQAAGKESKNFHWKDRSPATAGLVFGGFLAGLVLTYMGLKRRGKTSPNFLIGSDGDVDAPVSGDFVPSSSH